MTSISSIFRTCPSRSCDWYSRRYKPCELAFPSLRVPQTRLAMLPCTLFLKIAEFAWVPSLHFVSFDHDNPLSTIRSWTSDVFWIVLQMSSPQLRSPSRFGCRRCNCISHLHTVPRLEPTDQLSNSQDCRKVYRRPARVPLVTSSQLLQKPNFNPTARNWACQLPVLGITLAIRTPVLSAPTIKVPKLASLLHSQYLTRKSHWTPNSTMHSHKMLARSSRFR